MKDEGWEDVLVGGQWHRAARVSCAFELDGREHHSGAWLVWTRGAPYSQAMTDEEYERWRTGRNSTR